MPIPLRRSDMSCPNLADRATPHSRRILHDSMGISVIDFRCRAHIEPEGPEEPNATHSIVFVRRGLFQRTQYRETLIADPNHILFFNAAQPYRYSHPLPGGDDCTILAVATKAALELVSRHSPRDADRPDKPFRLAHGLSSPRTARLHYELLALLQRPVPGLSIEDALAELAEETVRTAYALRGNRTEQVGPVASARRRHRDLVEATKLAINESMEALPSLGQLALGFDCSPFHLSRIFHRVAGMSLRRYVGRLRASMAAERLSAGAPDLTELALDLGFADHSHFTNTFRREWGISPSRFRCRFHPL